MITVNQDVSTDADAKGEITARTISSERKFYDERMGTVVEKTVSDIISVMMFFLMSQNSLLIENNSLHAVTY